MTATTHTPTLAEQFFNEHPEIAAANGVSVAAMQNFNRGYAAATLANQATIAELVAALREARDDLNDSLMGPQAQRLAALAVLNAALAKVQA